MKKSNLVIDRSDRLDEDIEKFKIASVDEEKNFTSARIRVCRDPQSLSPMVFYSQELNRNFKNPQDPLSVRHVIKSFEPERVNASTDTALEFKFNDALLAHQQQIDEYSPLTDIHSNEMNLFIDEDTATYLADMGINIDHVGSEFQDIESVSATPFMQEVAGDVHELKKALSAVHERLTEVKSAMLTEMGIVGPASDEEFERLLSQHQLPAALIQKYLKIREEHDALKQRLDQAEHAVFDETKTRIKLPARIQLYGL